MRISSVLSAASLFVATCLMAVPAVSQTTTDSPDREITKVATTSAQFLKLGVGARAISMGGAFVAQANDLSAIYWNPAGLARLNGSSVQLAHTEYIADINYNYAAFGTKLGGLGTLAASLIFLDSGEMEVRTSDQPDGTGERFSVTDLAMQVSFARPLTDRFALGTTVKYVREQVWHSTASAFAFDIGLIFTTPFESLRLGASMANFGPKMQISGRDILFSTDPGINEEGNVEIVNSEFLTDEHPLPLLFSIGLAWDAFETANHRLALLTDASHPNDNTEFMNIGGEYSFRELVSLRAGYRNLFEEDGEQGLTLGAGLNLRLDRALRIAIDYAYADFGRLDETHWFTLDLQF